MSGGQGPSHLLEREVALAGRVDPREQVVQEAHEDDHVLWSVRARLDF